MTVSCSLDENDFLTYQLFQASQSDRIIKKRWRNRVLVPVAYIVLALIGYYNTHFILFIFFAVFAVLWFFFYPYWERIRYINHYKGFIKENYKERTGKSGTVNITKDFIIASEGDNKSNISTKEIANISEISSTIFIKLKSGMSFIIPKNKVNQIEELKNYLKELTKELNVNYINEENWKWK